MTVTRSLLPFVKLGLVDLVKVNDISPLVSMPTRKKLSIPGTSNQPLIACIDDSPTVSQATEKIITTAGYQFASEMDGLRAISMLLTRKPDLIFLDLIMLSTSGYEICSQLSQLAYFRHIPIVILTGNDGQVDRVRAKMVGSTDFVGKPVQENVVIEIINRYIPQKV